ncbi:MAG: redox-sensing transcriptional repressor Rex [Kiritimatiellae bacterium]|nr:redox-sensing transcriptional repressor Rex [Kiritimatiellia bacterium]
MDDLHRSAALPLPTIRRYPVYLRAVRARRARGESNVSSAALAAELGLDPVLVRKDLAMSGVSGRPRIGHSAEALEAALAAAIGWDNVSDAALVGVGSLGRALLGYRGFREQGLAIAVAFDSDPALAGRQVHGVRVRPAGEVVRLVRRLAIRLGILAVPEAAAQSSADALVAAGVRGIWNFAPVQLAVPADVVVQNMDLAQSLAVLSHAIR